MDTGMLSGVDYIRWEERWAQKYLHGYNTFRLNGLSTPQIKILEGILERLLVPWPSKTITASFYSVLGNNCESLNVFDFLCTVVSEPADSFFSPAHAQNTWMGDFSHCHWRPRLFHLHFCLPKSRAPARPPRSCAHTQWTGLPIFFHLLFINHLNNRSHLSNLYLRELFSVLLKCHLKQQGGICMTYFCVEWASSALNT